MKARSGTLSLKDGAERAIRSARSGAGTLWLFLFLAVFLAPVAETAPAPEEVSAPDALTSPSSPSPLSPQQEIEPEEALDKLSLSGLAPSDQSLVGSARPGMCAVWVNAEGAPLRSRENCRALAQRLREIHADAVFVVVRSMGDAFYRSELAPRPANWVDEDLDPLAEILQEAHRPGKEPLRVHAVLNLLPLYSRSMTFAPPSDHLMNRHPEWISRDEAGNERDADGVSWLDPAIPAAQRHLQAVVLELVTRYEVDGVHFAGLRYPGTDLRWGYNPLALEIFRSETGIPGAGGGTDKVDLADAVDSAKGEGGPAPAAPDWVRWRASRLTNLARLLTETARQGRPGVQVSVSVLATGEPPAGAGKAPDFQNALQYWPAWCLNDFFDSIVLDNPDIVETAEKRFVRWIDYGNARKESAKLLVQIPGAANTEAGVKRLLRLAIGRGCDGILLHSYQVPARDLTNGSDFLDFLGRTVFLPDYEMPAYVRNALMTTLPPVETFPDPEVFRELPSPLPISSPFTAAPEPLTEADITRALLGEDAFAELERVRERLAEETATPEIGALPEEQVSPSVIETATRVRVQLKNGRSFVGDLLGEGLGVSLFRPLGQSAVVSIPHGAIERVRPLEEEK